MEGKLWLNPKIKRRFFVKPLSHYLQINKSLGLGLSRLQIDTLLNCIYTVYCNKSHNNWSPCHDQVCLKETSWFRMCRPQCCLEEPHKPTITHPVQLWGPALCRGRGPRRRVRAVIWSLKWRGGARPTTPSLDICPKHFKTHPWLGQLLHPAIFSELVESTAGPQFSPRNRPWLLRWNHFLARDF